MKYEDNKEGVYEFGETNQAFKFHEGKIWIDGVEFNNGLIEARWFPKKEIRWFAEEPKNSKNNIIPIFDLEDKELNILDSKNNYFSLSAKITSTNPPSGYIPEIEIGDSKHPLKKVIAHWINGPNIIPGENVIFHYKNRTSYQKGRISFSGAGYNILIDPRPHLSKEIKKAKECGGYILSHAMEITREDGGSFTGKEAKDLLYALQLALSFARGNFTSPNIPTGFDFNNEIMWQNWSIKHAEKYGIGVSWWDPHTSEDLKDFLNLFLNKFVDSDPDAWKTLKFITQSALASNNEGFIEQKIVTAFSALDHLYWYKYVLKGDGKLSKKRKYEDQRIRRMIFDISHKYQVPKELKTLSYWAKTKI
ncbi:hypothetical protein [Haloactinospora alba]|uniref:hypothetical protein n=1 Tax=Haloactinospora alba TaxID=405555 RepID=UPI0011511FEB|nr:hypothetical protein [Haloactinospora alba]